MKARARCLLFGALLAFAQAGGSQDPSGVTFTPGMIRVTNSLDADWRFSKGDHPGAEALAYDDSKWTTVNVPHDWSIEGPLDAKNSTGGAGGFLPAGIGWYRKHLVLPGDYATRRVFVEFDGVMANSEVWINGLRLGKRPYGYVSFGYELTGHLNFGSGNPNVLAVRADNSGQPASRWYTGAGIYRHVRLLVTDPVHIAQWGIFVTTPQVGPMQATVHVRSTLVNESRGSRTVALQAMIISPGGRSAGTARSKPQVVPPGQSLDVDLDISVASPRLWDLSHPDLYYAYVILKSDGDVLDDELVTFGIREARFESRTGFWLNGKKLKIKGVCLHHDGGAFGAAVPLRVWERRLEHLREPLVRRQSQFADWTPTDQAAHEESVEAYSNCEEVELFLNGSSLGVKPRNADDSPRIWKVAYQPGTLRAVGRNKNAVVASHELQTAGKAARIVLAADRTRLSPEWDEVCFVTATVTDPNGTVVPGAGDLITFNITGPGIIAAVDSGNNSNSEPFQASERRAYQGRCYAILKAKNPRGKITLSASAPGLAGSAITIDAIAPAAIKK